MDQTDLRILEVMLRSLTTAAPTTNWKRKWSGWRVSSGTLRHYHQIKSCWNELQKMPETGGLRMGSHDRWQRCGSRCNWQGRLTPTLRESARYHYHRCLPPHTITTTVYHPTS